MTHFKKILILATFLSGSGPASAGWLEDLMALIPEGRRAGDTGGQDGSIVIVDGSRTTGQRAGGSGDIIIVGASRTTGQRAGTSDTAVTGGSRTVIIGAQNGNGGPDAIDRDVIIGGGTDRDVIIGGGSGDDHVEPDPAPADDPQPELVDMMTGGNACDLGDVQLNENGLLVEVGEMEALSDEMATARDRRQFCQLILLVRYQRGWTFGVSGVRMGGYAYLEGAETRARVAASSYFQGDQGQSDFVHEMDEWSAGEYTVNDRLKNKDIQWAPCGQNQATLNAKIDAGIFPPGDGFSYLTIEDRVLFRLKWKPC